MKDIRGELRAATGTPSDDEDGPTGFGGRKKSNAGFVLGVSNMRDYQAETTATGLENLFNSAFTIREDPLSASGHGKKIANKHEDDKGYVMDGETVRENVMVVRALIGLSVVLVVFFAFAISMAWVNPKSAIEGLLYEKQSLNEVHEVVEDFVQDYVGA
jgi:hypothetical protein